MAWLDSTPKLLLRKPRPQRKTSCQRLSRYATNGGPWTDSAKDIKLVTVFGYSVRFLKYFVTRPKPTYTRYIYIYIFSHGSRLIWAAGCQHPKLKDGAYRMMLKAHRNRNLVIQITNSLFLNDLPTRKNQSIGWKTGEYGLPALGFEACLTTQDCDECVWLRQQPQRQSSDLKADCWHWKVACTLLEVGLS